MNNKHEISGFFKRILLTGIILAGLQILVSFLIRGSFPIWKEVIGHIFVFAMTFLGYMGFVKLRTMFSEYTAYIFSGISLGKMLLTAIFLLPFILKPFEGRVFFVLQFMTIYMVYLFVEVVTLLKNMKDSPA